MDWIKSSISKKKDRDLSSPNESKEYFLSSDLAQEVLNDFLNFEELVKLPRGVDPSEWIASHSVAFFDHISLLFNCVSSDCGSNCSSSNPFLWVDEKGRKVKCNPLQYVDLLLSSVQKVIEDQAVFPTKYGNEFPASFVSTVKKIHQRLLQVINHIYQGHIKEVSQLQLLACLNTTYLHFRTFNDHFQLVDEKENELLNPYFKWLQLLMQQRLNQQNKTQSQQQKSEESSQATPSSSSSPSSPQIPPTSSPQPSSSRRTFNSSDSTPSYRALSITT